ncbi:MAG: glycoside hydrolase [Clostridiales bacterium]|jgi:sialidase-1|nr:glycoside hydrolase [Clostridiales bacterium]
MKNLEIFSAGEAESACYCSPGVSASNGAVIVFCEARLGNGADAGPHHLVYKRSADGGRSWGPLFYLEKADGVCYMNPVPVYAKEKLFVVYARADGDKRTQVFARESVDEGKNWSEARELTHLFSADPRRRSYHLPGPGHGLQLKNGRIAIPFWHRHPLRPLDSLEGSAAAPLSKREYTVNVIYSDDGGQSWKAGAYARTWDDAGMAYCMNECNIVQTPKELVLLARTAQQKGLPYRYRCASRDGGESFGEPQPVEGLGCGVQCCSGLAALADDSYILTRPNSAAYPRRSLELYASHDTSRWQRRILLEAGFSAYSDIAVHADDGLLVVYNATQYSNALGKTVRCVLLDRNEL